MNTDEMQFYCGKLAGRKKVIEKGMMLILESTHRRQVHFEVRDHFPSSILLCWYGRWGDKKVNDRIPRVKFWMFSCSAHEASICSFANAARYTVFGNTEDRSYRTSLIIVTQQEIRGDKPAESSSVFHTIK
ncbi:predicted protein [Sclerotinia sclerotiorum 1980 UF-70]|uniref:Uncharacterized protein n=1 Tax=Sclerotinia sclerotiorum (strain ATCC 18683 / 1980 / Ss-1) TaxID=665079 RepID=A7EQC8_SCLS1|nr:predicted protein [Sclerotinia sclerotiorum 1980 UF-70]EDO05044.1 predicted protein [Sclerotinia sclerotiorum 1980 UF-70]